MPLPDPVAARIRRAFDDVLASELGGGGGAGALHEAVRPMLQRAFERGVGLGVTLTTAASGQGIDSLKSGLAEHFGTIAVASAVVTAPAASRPIRRPRSRFSTSGKTRAAPGAVGQAVELVLADQPGLRIIEIQDIAVGLDPTISRSSIVNELRRKLGRRYRQEGVRWFLIGDPEQASGLDRGNTIPGLEMAGGEAGTPASTSSIERAA